MENTNKASSHAVFNIQLHIVLVTQYRRKMRTPERLESLRLGATSRCLAPCLLRRQYERHYA